MVRICFVCLGNICRSPTAEGVMRKLIADRGFDGAIAIDSAGTGAYHAGEAADARARQTAAGRGIRLDSIARQFEHRDFERFDYVVAMDRDNLRELRDLAPNDAASSKVHLFRSFDPAAPDGAEVPDPYYGGERGFDDVFDICEAACRGLLEQIARDHGLG